MGYLFNPFFYCEHRKIGEGEPAFIIAEAGVSHFGDMEKAFRLVDMAVSAKADAVKFQIFKTENLVSSVSREWQERLKPKELEYHSFKELKKYCEHNNIIFLATAHDDESLNFLSTLNVGAFKIGSGELQNTPFIHKIASLKRPVFVSTGMHTREDIESILVIFEKEDNPNLCLLHCVTAYPTPPQDANLYSIQSIKNEFKVMSGYSDHTEGIHFPLAAVALGARVIEKHISLDFNVPDAQDWKVSCGENNLAEMILKMREIEAGLGDGILRVADSESGSISWARKSLTAKRKIAAGETFSADNIVFKRPGIGIPPSELNKVLGKKARSTIEQDSIIDWAALS